jgi:TonB family protein
VTAGHPTDGPPDDQPETEKQTLRRHGGAYHTMKHVSMFTKSVSLFALGAVAPLAFGLTTTQAYINSYSGRTDIPVPVKIVAPEADSSLAGVKVEVEFTVDATGKLQDVHVLSTTDDAFGALVRETVKQWKFAPAKPNGTPVSMKVLLPVVVSESE